MNEKEARELSDRADAGPIPITLEEARAKGYLEAVKKADYIIRLLSDWGPLIKGEIEKDFERITERWDKMK